MGLFQESAGVVSHKDIQKVYLVRSKLNLRGLPFFPGLNFLKNGQPSLSHNLPQRITLHPPASSLKITLDPLKTEEAVRQVVHIVSLSRVI